MSISSRLREIETQLEYRQNTETDLYREIAVLREVLVAFCDCLGVEITEEPKKFVIKKKEKGKKGG